MAKECTLKSGTLSLGGLPSNCVVRITDHPNMTSAAVYRGCKAAKQKNLQHKFLQRNKQNHPSVIVKYFSKLGYCMSHLSLVVRKPAFCIWQNKDADQLHGNRETDQRLCFHYSDSTIPLLPKSEISSL